MQIDDELLTKLAYMYYIDNLPQAKIAATLGISRSTASRLLQTARDRGIVKVEINPANSRCFSLEKVLKEKYNIDEVIVVPLYSTKSCNILRTLGQAGANFLRQNIKDGMTISFSMGKTLSAVADCLEIEKKIQCSVIPITGGQSQVNPEYHSNDICRRVADNFGGIAHALYAPSIVSSENLKEGIIADPMIQKVFEYAKKADFTVVSVGNVSTSTFLDLGIIGRSESEEMKELGVIGDIGGWFLDKKGKILDLEIHKRVVGPDLMEISQDSKMVLMAGADSKKEAIKAALMGNWIDVLITDEEVATYLIS